MNSITLKKISLLILFISVFVSPQIRAQSPKKEDLSKTINEFLKSSENAQEVERLVEILGDQKIKYQSPFLYIPSINPLNPKNNIRFSSTFGKRFHPVDKKQKAHLGLDIAAKTGTPVHAAANGIMTLSKYSEFGLGNHIIIRHKFGFVTKYGHMYRLLAKENDRIKRGDIIGFVGSTGKSTGDHLHYEVLKNSKHIDPYPFCFLKI